MDRYPHPDWNDLDVLSELEATAPLRAYMVQLAHIMTDLGKQLVKINACRFVDDCRLVELVRISREASALGKELMKEVSKKRSKPTERYGPLETEHRQEVGQGIQKENGASLASNPIQSNPIQSNPIQSNPILLPNFRRAAFKRDTL